MRQLVSDGKIRLSPDSYDRLVALKACNVGIAFHMDISSWVILPSFNWGKLAMEGPLQMLMRIGLNHLSTGLELHGRPGRNARAV